MRNSRRLATVLCSFATLMVVACGNGEPTAEAPPTQDSERQVFRFSAIPDQNSTETLEKLEPLIAYLSQQLDTPFEYVPARDYQASVEMFKNGDIQLAWFGGLTGVQARGAVAGARAIAQGESDPQFYSYFIAHRDTGLELSDEFPSAMAGFKFAFGSESSTSGRLMPEFFIHQHTGKTPGEFFEHPVAFSGSHDKTVKWVESGQFEAGVVNYAVYDRRVADGEADPDIVRVIWKTPHYADYNWTVHPDVDATFGVGFTDRLQHTLLSIDDPQLLTALPRQRLIAASNEDFEGIRQVAESLDMVR